MKNAGSELGETFANYNTAPIVSITLQNIPIFTVSTLKFLKSLTIYVITFDFTS